MPKREVKVLPTGEKEEIVSLSMDDVFDLMMSRKSCYTKRHGKCPTGIILGVTEMEIFRRHLDHLEKRNLIRQEGKTLLVANMQVVVSDKEAEMVPFHFDREHQGNPYEKLINQRTEEDGEDARK